LVKDLCCASLCQTDMLLHKLCMSAANLAQGHRVINIVCFLESSSDVRSGWGDAGLTPTDCHCFVAAVWRVDKPVPKKPVSAAAWVTAFLAHAIKWPPVVDHFAELMQTDPLTGPDSMVQLARKCLLFANNKCWPTMFRRMNAGRGPCNVMLLIICLTWLPAKVP
jgi:hypothetical protein